MGFKKFLGSLAGDIKDSIEEKREQRRVSQEQHQEYASLVDALLDKFEIRNLDDFLMRYLNQRPELRQDGNKGGGKRQARPGRKEYLDMVWKCLEDDEISYEQLRDFATKNRIVSPSFFKVESWTDADGTGFQDLINAIQTGFEPEKIELEEHLQSQLAVFLKAKYPDRKIDREVSTKYGDRIDIVIDDAYAFELKVPTDRATLRNLGAQLEEYLEQYPNLCAVIYDDLNKDLSQTINDYADRYKQKYGIQTIIIRGTRGQRPR